RSFGCSLLDVFLCWRSGDGESEYYTFILPVFSPNLSPMCFHDATADRKTDTHAALVAARSEGLEQFGVSGLWNSGTGIGDANLHHPIPTPSARDFNFLTATRLVVQNLNRIAEKVDQDLLNLDAIDH